jgi:hypothetical protein
LREGLAAMPLLDVHTHLDAGHLTARGLHDVLLYHMVVSDLVSAGCPSRARLSDDPAPDEIAERVEEAIPYLEYIQNTSCFWGVRLILRDLYGWDTPLTPGNWREADALIREKAADSGWAREIMRRAGVQRACTELWRGRAGSADDILQYALEWAFFVRAQWGIHDIPLYELECAWNQAEPGAPLPINLGEQRAQVSRVIRTVDDVYAAMAHYVDRIPFGRVLSTAQHISTDLNLRQVTEEEMAAALRHREQASEADRDVYAGFILEAFLKALEQKGQLLVFQFSFGAEPLLYETGVKLRQESVFQVADIVSRHPGVQFQVFLASAPANQALCSLCRELPNLSLAGYWWHNFFPGYIRQIIAERLDMLAANRWAGFFSDAYALDWTYAKSQIVRWQWADVLATKVQQGQYSVDEALSIARQVFYEAPQTLLGMEPAGVLGGSFADCG